MAYDSFDHLSQSSMTPSENCFTIVPNDSTELPLLTKAIYIGTGGDLRVLTGQIEAPVTFRNVVSGSVLDVRIRAVLSTGTTASDLVGLA